VPTTRRQPAARRRDGARDRSLRGPDLAVRLGQGAEADAFERGVAVRPTHVQHRPAREPALADDEDDRLRPVRQAGIERTAGELPLALGWFLAVPMLDPDDLGGADLDRTAADLERGQAGVLTGGSIRHRGRFYVVTPGYDQRVTRTRIPDAILDAAHARSRARAERNWAEADRLRAEIEAAGWTIVDRGTDFALSPVHPPDTADGGRTRYGASASVPSRLADPPTGQASVVLVATDWPADVERALDGLRDHAPDGTDVVLVANGPSDDQDAALTELEAAVPADRRLATEVVWTSERLGHAAALNAGVRRARASVVVLLDPSVEPTGDLVTPLVRALEDPTVAVAGPWGVRSRDLRRFEEAAPGEVDAIEAYALAFRRADYAARGPLDERFRFYRNLDLWWSLVLRDEGEGSTPRRALHVADVPAVRHEHRGWESVDPAERERLSKRNFYRILDRFGARRDLLVGS